ncbi:hypothetical protein ACN47E_004451 [Coniothyrium glycines]
MEASVKKRRRSARQRAGAAPVDIVDQRHADFTLQERENLFKSSASGSTGVLKSLEGKDTDLVTLQIDATGNSTEPITFSLPRSIHHRLNISEWSTVTQEISRDVMMFESAATYAYKLFRAIKAHHSGSTKMQDLSPSDTSTTSCVRLSPTRHSYNRLFSSSPSPLLLSFDFYRPQKAFHFMDLPVELRVMIAKFVFYQPKGLSWFWKVPHQGSRIATLHVPYGADLDTINALARTCKALYYEIRGLFLEVNVILFGTFSMFKYGSVSQFISLQGDLSYSLTATLDALKFYRRNVPPYLQGLLRRIHFTLMQEEISDYVCHVTNIDAYTEVTAECYDWKLSAITNNHREALEYEGRFSKDYEHEHMQKQAVDFLNKGKGIQQLVASLTAKSGKWRVSPLAKAQDKVDKFKNYFTEDEMKMVVDWCYHGIQI